VAHRDYKQTTPKRSSGKRKKGGLLKSLLLVLVLTSAIAGGLLWFLWPRPQDFRHVHSTTAPEPSPGDSTTETAPPVVKGAATTGQDYTFYNILPGNQLPKPLPPDKTQWWLQVAALKNASDADSLRARLSLLNYTAVVQPTPAGEPLLYRVRVGPYPDRASAVSAQQTLAMNKIDSQPVKAPVTP